MTRSELVANIQRKRSYLCVGLDTQAERLPALLRGKEDALLTFNKAIIDATKDLAVAYKPNLAFYEQYGAAGWEVLKETIAHVPDDCLVIADAKRGDIGNTASAYARALFEDLGADAVTVAPYMGKDTLTPFLEHEDKWTIVLGLTSNPGAADFQFHGEPPLHERVIKQCAEWGSPEQLMFVVGATRPEAMEAIRSWVPDHFWLVPGVGAQGGSLTDVSNAALTHEAGLLVNSSRGIIYAGDGEDYAEKARDAAHKLQLEMSALLD